MHSPDNDDLNPPIMTETMAKLLLGQRHWREAIDIYRELSRQNPEKATLYQGEIAQIEHYFKAPANPITSRKRQRTRKQITRLENLLRVVQQQQPDRDKLRTT